MRLIKLIAAWLALLAAPLALTACGGDDAGNNVTAPPVATVKAPEGKKWSDVVEKTGEGWYRQGNPAAPIKLIEYGSRSCPVCGAFAMTGVEPLREKYINTGQVSLEFRDFLVHPQDLGIALLGRCVSTEAFFPILDQMYANQPAFNEKTSQMTDAMYAQIQGMNRQDQAKTLAQILGYTDFMKQRGMPEPKIQQCLSDTNATATLSKQLEEATVKGVDGTPTFFINDKKVEGAVGWAQLEPALKAAGAH
jgi:protein-disulfide isomerase